ncbi:MAG: hypothetical protein ACYTBZ_00550 [Planctomycetota bacterium]
MRLSEKVYKAAKNIASRRGISINRLVQEAIAEKADKALETRLKKAYDLLAEDQEESDAEVFFAAQAEALLND